MTSVGYSRLYPQKAVPDRTECEENAEMADPPRARRLAKRIAQIVASGLEHEVKDPRLTMVTITDAKVTGDLRDATVYYTVLGETVDTPPDTAGAAAALGSGTRVLPAFFGRGTSVPVPPPPSFCWR